MTRVVLECACGASVRIPDYNLLYLRQTPSAWENWVEEHRATGCQLLDQPPTPHQETVTA
jgi:hypothetical protein